MSSKQHLKFIIDGEDKSGQAVRGFRGNVDGANSSMTSGITTAAKWGAAIVTAASTAGVFAVSQFASFESSMSAVKAITDSTGLEMIEMTDLAKELGRTTAFTSQQAADGMKFLGMAGFDTNEILQAMPATLDLAAASGIELGRAADIASNILSQFKIEASDTARVVDVLAKTVTSSNTDMEQLSEAMKYLGPTAAAFGVSIEEAAASVGLLGNSGIQGSIATRALGTAMTRLAKPTDSMLEVMNDLNVSFFNAKGEFIGLNKMIGEMERGTKGLTDEQKQMAISTLFGAEAIQEVNVLMSSGSDVMEAYTKELENADGSAKKMAKTMLDNVKGSWVIMKSAVSGATIALGGALAGAFDLKGGLLSLGDFINSSITPAIEGMGEVLQVVGEGVRDFFFSVIIPAVSIAKIVFEGLIGTMNALSGVFSSVVNSFAQSDIITGFLSIVNSSLVASGGSFSSFKDSVKASLSVAKDVAKSFADWFGEYIAPIITSVVEIIIGALVLLTAAWQSNFLGIQDITKTVFTAIKDFISSSLEFIRGVLDIFIGFFTGDWERMMQGVQDTSDGFLGAIKALFDVSFGLILDLASNFGGVLHGTFDSMGQGISSNLGEFWENVKSMASDSMNSMLELVSSGALLIANAWDNTWQGMKDGFVVIWNSIIDYLETKVNQAIKILNKMIEGINKIPGVSVPMIGYVDINSNGASGTGRRAFGGSVLPDRSYLVGERGPEMFTPGTSGSITPNNALRDPNGGQSVNVEIVIQGDVYSESMLDQITNGVKDAIQGDLASARMGAI